MNSALTLTPQTASVPSRDAMLSFLDLLFLFDWSKQQHRISQESTANECFLLASASPDRATTSPLHLADLRVKRDPNYIVYSRVICFLFISTWSLSGLLGAHTHTQTPFTLTLTPKGDLDLPDKLMFRSVACGRKPTQTNTTQKDPRLEPTTFMLGGDVAGSCHHIAKRLVCFIWLVC